MKEIYNRFLFYLFLIFTLIQSIKPTGILREFTEECFKTEKEYPQKRQYDEKMKSVVSAQKFEATLDKFIELLKNNEQIDFINQKCWIDNKAPTKELISKMPDNPNQPPTFEILEKERLNLRHPYAQKLIVPSNSLINIFGDIHGSIHSLIRSLWRLRVVGFINEKLEIIKKNGYMIFLGDYVDRGRYSTEVLYILMQLKIQNPNKVFLLRGNHEDPLMGGITIRDEIKQKYKDTNENKILWKLACLYDLMPHVLYLGCNNNFVQCCHGGIDPSYNPVNLLTNIDEKIIYESLLGKKDKSDLLPNEIRNEALEHFRIVEQMLVSPNPSNPENAFFAVGLNWEDFARAKNSKGKWICNDKHIVFSGHGYNASVDVLDKYLKTLNEKLKSSGISLNQIIRGHQHTNFGISLLDNSFPVELEFSWGDKTAKVRDWAGVVKSDKITDPLGFKVANTGSPATSFLSAPEGVGKDTAHGTILKYEKDCFGILRTGNKWENWFLKPFDFQIEARKKKGLYCSIGIGNGTDPIQVSFSETPPEKIIDFTEEQVLKKGVASYGLEPSVFKIVEIEKQVNDIFKEYRLKRLTSDQTPIEKLPRKSTDIYTKKIGSIKFPIQPSIKTQTLNWLRAFPALKENQPLTENMFTNPLTSQTFNELTKNDNDIRETCLNMIIKEIDLQNNYYVFYHSHNPTYSILYDIYQQIYNFGLIKTNQPLALRIPQKKYWPKSLDNFLDSTKSIVKDPTGQYIFYSEGEKETNPWFDHIPLIREQLLSVNFSLFGNETNPGTESTFKFATKYNSLSNHNLDPLENAFDFCKINRNFISKIIYLHDKYLQHRIKKSVILQLFIKKNVVNEVVYLSKSGGKPIEKESFNETMSDFLNMYINKPITLNSELSKYDYQGIYRTYSLNFDRTQGRIWLPSPRLYNQKQTKIFRYLLHPLSEEEQENEKKFKNGITNIFDAIIKNFIREIIFKQIDSYDLKGTPFEVFIKNIKSKSLQTIHGIDRGQKRLLKKQDLKEHKKSEVPLQLKTKKRKLQKYFDIDTLINTINLNPKKANKLITNLNLNTIDDESKLNITEQIINSKSEKFYKFIKQVLPTIDDEACKRNIIQSIIKNKIEDLYPAVKQALPTIKDEFCKANIIQSIINNKREDLYYWIKETLPKIKDKKYKYNKSNIIQSIIKNKIKNLYPAVEKILPTIDDEFCKANIIQSIINNKREDLYYWIEETLPKIEGKYDKSSIIQSIIKNKKEDLYYWVKQALPIIDNEFYKSRIIQSIINNKREDFYYWVKETLPIIDDEFCKANIIQSIINNKREDLYYWIKQALPTIKNENDKSYIIQLIINNKIEDLYPAVKETLPTIKDEFCKANIIQSIINNKIEDLYPAVKQALPTIKDKYNKNDIIQSIINNKIEDLYPAVE